MSILRGATRNRATPRLCGLQILALLVSTTASFGSPPKNIPSWVHNLSSPEPGPFKPASHPPLSGFNFGWAFLHAGTGTAKISVSSGNQIQMEATAHTEGAVRSLFRIDAHFHCLASARSLRPVEARQTEAYADESLETVLHFDPYGVVRRRSSVPVPKKGTGKPKRFAFTPLFEPFTAYLWLRSQPNRPGDTHQLVIYAGADPFLLRASVQPREHVLVGSALTPAIRINLEFSALDRSLQTAPYRKCKSASLWISDSTARRLLRAEADIFIGKIWLQLQPPPVKGPP
ncbi:MAG: hypothetical protein RLZZ253_1720 [Verrucomicrobiota bacterium]